jgi:tetratricopeptide (TPR) repeat protein
LEPIENGPHRGLMLAHRGRVENGNLNQQIRPALWADAAQDCRALRKVLCHNPTKTRHMHAAPRKVTTPAGPAHVTDRFNLIICVLLGVGTWVSFWPAVSAQFLNYDDNEYVTNNPMVLSGLGWRGVAWALVTDHACNWHPLTWASHMLDVSLFGRSPAGPHCVNILFHTLNAILLFMLLAQLTKQGWPSVIVAALFAWHPLHVESVAWVAERKDVLSAFFCFLTLLAYGAWARVRISPAPSSRAGHRAYAASLGCFALGLMSKPMVVTLPFLMLLLDFWPLGRMASGEVQAPKAEGLFLANAIKFRRLVLEKLPFLFLSAGACAATIWAQKGAIQPLEHLPLAERIGNALIGYTRYLGKAIWPVDLALPYLHPGHWPAVRVWGAVAILAGLSTVAFRAVRQKPYLLMGWLWFLGTLIPVIGIVQVGTQAIADRYTYIPLIGPFIAVVWGLNDGLRRLRSPNLPAFATAVALGFCCVLTFRQAGFWKDSETLFKHADAVTTNNFIAVANVGGVLFEQGYLEQAMDWYKRSYEMNPRYVEAVNSIGAVLAAKGSNEATLWFQRALEIQPNHPQALFNMGNAMARKGDTPGAVTYFEAAVRVKPDNYEARNNLGNALFKLHRVDEAIAQFEAALRVQPQAALVHKNLGEALAARGRLNEATIQYLEALELTNDTATHYSLGMAWAVQNKWEPAIEQYRETLRFSPTNAEAHYNLGYALAITGRAAEAGREYAAAVGFRPDFPIAHYNLGCVLAEMGKREEAISHLQQALEQQPDYKEAKEKLAKLEADK